MSSKMSTVFRNARDLHGGPLAFAVERGLFSEVVPEIDAPGARDLQGATVLPGFIDAHCHVMPTGFDLSKLSLDECRKPEEVLDAVRDRLREVPDGEWLLAVHYDQTRFSSNAHLHKQQLDALGGDVPILLRHTNGHASVVNSAALRAANVSETTEDPKGGTYVRDENGRLTGVLLERAHEHVTDAAPRPSAVQMKEAALRAARKMVRHGITCASDMMTGYSDLERELEGYLSASEGGSPVRLRLYLQWSEVFGARAVPSERRMELTQAMEADACKVAGAKIFADGAISAGTAAIYREFSTGGNGKLIYEPERLKQMVMTAHEAGWPVSVHSIGDRSTDLVMDAFEQTDEPSRHRLEHAMVLSDAQVARLARIGCHVAMQPEFLMRLGHAYKRQLPQDVAAELVRARSCLAAGVRLSFNSDRPIVAGDPWDGIITAAARPEGFDQAENTSVEQGVVLYTRGGADANGDLGVMGEIKEGQLADFQVYSPGITGPAKPSPDEVYMGGELKYRKGS